MWQLAVVTRFQALQSYLSNDEHTALQHALCDNQDVNGVSDDMTSMSPSCAAHENVKLAQEDSACDLTTIPSSSHLERWTKWKLDKEDIDRLTCAQLLPTDPYTTNAGDESEQNGLAPLRFLEANVTNLQFFARGKRGVLYAGQLRSSAESVVVKIGVDSGGGGSSATSTSVTMEAKWLRVMNRMGIGARLIDAGEGWFVCEKLNGVNVVEFLTTPEVATPANAAWVVREMLCQCFAMDLIGVNKEEMTHPHRHIILHILATSPQETFESQAPLKWKCTFIDFEKCAYTKKPKNVTQLCQFLASPRMTTLLGAKGMRWDVQQLRQATKRYKQSLSSRTFGNLMRVFGL